MYKEGAHVQEMKENFKKKRSLRDGGRKDVGNIELSL